jgi:hypothetical protein
LAKQSELTATDRDERREGPVCLPVPQLFAVLRCDDLRASPSRHSLAHVDEVLLGRGDEYAAERRVDDGVRRLELRLPDRRMSRNHARLRRSAQGWQFSDLGSSNGSRIEGERSREAKLADGAFFELGHSVFRLREALPTPADASGDLRGDALADRPFALRSLLPELLLGLERLSRVARSSVSTLLLGETGTGKEWLARALHELSGRSGAFVALNCGALPASLLESLLFGHVRGAFSGAMRDEPGYVRAADGGTLFLDEIGDLPPLSQTALLRVLQEREVVPVGATRAIAVDLRVVAATHAALFERAEQGSFRNDLFARLSGYSFQAIPLRDRIEDLGLILNALAPELEREAGAPLTLHPDAARQLLAYHWPRNIRELQQALQSAAVLAEDRHIRPEHLPQVLQPRAATPSEEIELEQRLLQLFHDHQGNVTQVAKAMGKARVQVQRWMKRFGIDPTNFR